MFKEHPAEQPQPAEHLDECCGGSGLRGMRTEHLHSGGEGTRNLPGTASRPFFITAGLFFKMNKLPVPGLDVMFHRDEGECHLQSIHEETGHQNRSPTFIPNYFPEERVLSRVSSTPAWFGKRFSACSHISAPVSYTHLTLPTIA